MDTPFLTLSDAAQKTGRSLSTIRRIVRTIADAQSHPDRQGIEPTPQKAAELKKKGEIFAWKIREDVLLRRLNEAQEKAKKMTSESKNAHGDIMDVLRNELNLKNQQIEKQWKVIDALNERLREGNILMGSLQQRLALPEKAATPPPPVETEPIVSSVEASVESSEAVVDKAAKVSSKKTPPKPSVKESRRGILGWFRK